MGRKGGERCGIGYLLAHQVAAFMDGRKGRVVITMSTRI